MEETKPSKSETKREKQPISIPFVWEEKPGTPKKDWKPSPQPIKGALPPVKLVVSVPFGWEEKPGTPLPSFVQQPPTEPVFVASQERGSNIFSSPARYSGHDYGNNDDQGEIEGDYGSSDSEVDAYSVETDDSFTSAKSLLANGLISTTTLSNAVPVQQTASLALITMDGEQMQSPGSPASETESTSSYATGTTSLAGASFLEWLFPLLVQKSSVPNKVGCPEMDSSEKAPALGKEFLHETNSSQVKRPLLTLGELIVMSRRRSCQRKVMTMHKQRSMDFMKRNTFGCCISGIGNGINGLHMKWKRQLQLKLM